MSSGRSYCRLGSISGNLALGECTSRTNTETNTLFNKERRSRESSARERENDKATRDKRPAEEIQEEVIEEIGPFSKAHKIKENISHRALVNAEGTCDNPIPTTGHLKGFQLVLRIVTDRQLVQGMRGCGPCSCFSLY